MSVLDTSDLAGPLAAITLVVMHALGSLFIVDTYRSRNPRRRPPAADPLPWLVQKPAARELAGSAR